MGEQCSVDLIQTVPGQKKGHPMSSLRVFLFGGFQITHLGDCACERTLTRSVQALLAYLLLHRRYHPRDTLLGLFWGDHSEERARSCLSTALWRVRRVLEPRGVPRGTYLLTTPTGEIGFNRDSDYWLDVAEFEKQVAISLHKPVKEMKPEDADELEAAIELCSGELLEGFYEDWALSERERLRSLYLRSLARLMKYFKGQKNFKKALICGKRILNLDPLREEIHREVMRLYFESGRRAMAIQQYKKCSRVLEQELDIPVMEETQTLYECIVAGAIDQPPIVLPGQVKLDIRSGEKVNFDLAFQRIYQAMQHFEKTKEQLQQAIRYLESLVRGSDSSKTK